MNSCLTYFADGPDINLVNKQKVEYLLPKLSPIFRNIKPKTLNHNFNKLVKRDLVSD